MSSAADQALAPTQALNSSARSFVAFCRWSSAIVVMLSHLRAVMFLGWGELPQQARTIPTAALYSATAFSHEAVVVFFVLSGFLVAGPNIDRARLKLFRPKDYSADRFTRIYVTLLPALLLTVVADAIGRNFLPWTGFYDGSNALIQQRFENAFHANGPGDFLANLLMLQPIHVPVFGSNVPLWSLSYEVWFYVWFGLVAFGSDRDRDRRSMAICAIAATIGLILFHWSALVGLAIWALGAGAYQWQRWPRSMILAVTALFLSLGLALSGRLLFTLGSFELSDFAVGLSFAWVLALMKLRSYRVLSASEPLNQRLSDFSYSLYVVHFPTMLCVLGLALEATGLAASIKVGLVPNARSMAVYAATACITVVIAFAFSWLFERRTAAVRRWLKSSLRSAR